MIDYVLRDENVREMISSTEVGSEVDSEHFPLIVEMKRIRNTRCMRRS